MAVAPPVLNRAIETGSPDIVQLLVDAGADVNATDDSGTPLLFSFKLNPNPPKR